MVMGTKVIKSTASDALRASHLSRPSSLLSRRLLTRMSLAGCLLWMLSLLLLHWGGIEIDHGSSVTGTKSSNEWLVSVSAFPQRSCNPRRSHSLQPCAMSPLLFPEKDHQVRNSQVRNIVSGKQHRGTISHSFSHYDRPNICYRSSHSPLFGGSSNDSDKDGASGDPLNEPSSNDGNKKRSSSMRRIGGRKRRERQESSSSSSSSSNIVETIKNKLPFPSGAGLLLTALLVLTLLKNLLFGGGGGADYYCYSYSSSSSSVYETRINPDGSRTTTETSRNEKSDLQTNIPGLTGQKLLDRQNAGSSMTTNYFYFDED